MLTGCGSPCSQSGGPAQDGSAASRFHELRRVVTDLAVLDFASPDHAMRLASLHPGVSMDDVVANTGFELVIDGEVLTTRLPTAEELRLIRDVIDPAGARHGEVPDA